MLAGRSVLVTGGAGAFGQAFVRRCLDDGARRVVVFSRSESRQAEMQATFSDSRLRFFLGDVRDRDRLVQAMHTVDTVVHAAAQKRVETCQQDPGEAKRTNIDGTENVALAAITCDVERALFLSSDKSASASTTYGSSKLFGEGYWLAANNLAAGRVTKFAATRYGNVVASTGSVIPLWRSQAAAGGPLTITDRRCTRFLMTMDAAVSLVVTALGAMHGGEIFVPKLRGARMVDLAEAIAPGMPLADVGLRGIEKLHETLISADEFRVAKELENYYIIFPHAVAVEGAVGEREDYRSDGGSLMSIAELQDVARPG